MELLEILSECVRDYYKGRTASVVTTSRDNYHVVSVILWESDHFKNGVVISQFSNENLWIALRTAAVGFMLSMGRCAAKQRLEEYMFHEMFGRKNK